MERIVNRGSYPMKEPLDLSNPNGFVTSYYDNVYGQKENLFYKKYIFVTKLFF